MNYQVVGKELVKRFGNKGSKAIHAWLRQHYGRIVSKADGQTTLDNVSTQSVFNELERYLNCFANITPAQFVRWFNLVPAYDRFGRTQASVDVLPAMYMDTLLSANPLLTFDSVVLRGDDLIDAPSTSEPMNYQISSKNYNNDVRAVALSVTDGKKTATLVIPENEVQQIIEVHKRTKYGCDPLDTTEWNALLIGVCFRRFMSFSDAGYWVRNIAAQDMQSLDLLDAQLHAVYQQHAYTQDVKDDFSGRLVANVVQPASVNGDTLAALNQSANEVRKRLGLPSEGCDASVLALDADFLAQKSEKRTKVNVVPDANNVVSFGLVERTDYDPDDFSDTEWGGF